MAIQRTPMYDDDGSGEVGTVVNNDWKTEFYNQIDAYVGGVATGGGTSIIAMGLAPGSSTNLTTNPGQIRIAELYGTADGTPYPIITGADPGNPNDLLIIHNGGAYPILLNYGNAAGKFYNFVTSGPTPLGGLMSSAIYRCLADGRWFLISHEQGGPITAPFSAANFTGDANTWTVSAGNVSSLAYYLRGRQLTVYVAIVSSSLAGVVNFVMISNAAYGGYVASANSDCLGYVFDAGVNSVGRALCGPAWAQTAKIQIQKMNGQMQAGTCHVEVVASLVVS